MPHSLTANARKRHFHSATIADHALMFYALVFAATAFPIALGSEYSFAKQTALFRFVSAVIDCLGIFDLPVAP